MSGICNYGVVVYGVGDTYDDDICMMMRSTHSLLSLCSNFSRRAVFSVECMWENMSGDSFFFFFLMVRHAIRYSVDYYLMTFVCMHA